MIKSLGLAPRKAYRKSCILVGSASYSQVHPCPWWHSLVRLRCQQNSLTWPIATLTHLLSTSELTDTLKSNSRHRSSITGVSLVTELTPASTVSMQQQKMERPQRRAIDPPESSSDAIPAVTPFEIRLLNQKVEREEPEDSEQAHFSPVVNPLPGQPTELARGLVCTCPAPDPATQAQANSANETFPDASKPVHESSKSTVVLPKLTFPEAIAHNLISFTKSSILAADEAGLRQEIKVLQDQLAAVRAEKTSMEESLVAMEESFSALEIQCNELSGDLEASEASVGFANEDQVKECFIRLSHHIAAWCDEASYHAGACGMSDADLRMVSLEIGLEHSLDKARLSKATSAVLRAIIFRKLSKEVFCHSTANLILDKDLYLSEDEAKRIFELEQKLLEEGAFAVCSCFNTLSVDKLIYLT